MIITEAKPIDEILKYLADYTKVFIVGCGSCATQCKTGGEEEVLEMKQLLENSGKKITGSVIPDESCHLPLMKKRLKEHSAEIENSDAILVMSCGSGVQAVAQIKEVPVFPSTDTTFLGNTKRIGDFAEFCSMCGECKLGKTAAICPVTRCSKGMSIGPCGGMDKGKCEVDNDRDCAWVLIYESLKKRGKLHQLEEMAEPRDFSRNKKPHDRKV